MASIFILDAAVIKTVFIVHESSSLRQIASATLKEAGYDVLEAIDGKDALSKLDGRKVQLIISDIHLPYIDGIEFVKAAKQIPAYKFTPVIMLAHHDTSEAIKAAGHAAGVTAWVPKPFQPQQMLMAVSKRLMP